MLLKNLPDFQYCLTAAGNRVFAAHEKAGEYILMPDSLALARPDGKNRACRLTLVRGRSPKLAPDPHGLLECMPGLHYPWEEALQSIRKLRPGAVLRPAGFSRCGIFLELPDGKRVSGELNGTHFLSRESGFGLKLSEEAACMAKSLQENGLNGVSGVAEVVLEGVSPRLPVKVRFDSRKLLAGIENFSGKGQGIGRPEILKFFSQPPEYLLLEISGKLKEGTLELNPWLFAETLADRFIYRFGTQLSSGIKGSFEWDLSVPCRVFRSYVLPLRTFEAPGKATSCRELVVPAFRTEPMQVKVSADLPFRIYGLFALGVTLRVPPIPGKSSGVSKSVELKPEEKYRAVISPDIFPTAEPEYTYSTFAVVRAPYGPKLLNSPEKTHKGSKLNLTAPDFPLDYVWIEASRRLLDIAELHGTCTWLEAGLEIRQPFDFDFEASKEEEEEEKGEEEEKTCKLAIAVPREREGKKQEEIPLIEIRALSRTDEKMLCLARRGKKLCLDLPSFPEYGPQKLEIRCIFEPGAKFCVIELLPEGKEPCRKYISVRHFTPSSPLQEWTWFADSPFRGGYRFRKKVFDKEPGPWLNPLNPSVPLLIRVKAGEEREEPEQQGTKTSRTRTGPGTRGSEKS